ncbi:hypothetical protein Z517_09276 [Fonsecaea pedrosoi CBS 271.37]|uniref:Uncharacterized protein n=1 Tax=Fonsecaea pedrosoi CBS 271.37 TaxID=1442368 RepID=A0A0D2ERF0_9EURO|nr:uncharacterized protein Z517_09276 [Fonsecaea pedrosoi CBS 271.37]KIW76832.1 hypothetical protein Z517_09276 [Fonsecaea pedrosoi CBS 271.37]
MAEHLVLWQNTYNTDGHGNPIKAEFMGQFGISPVRLVFCKEEPSADDVELAPYGATSIFFTRQTLDWDAALEFDKRVIVFGSREYRECNSRRSQPWSEEMKPQQHSFLPIELAVLHDPTIYLHAAATLFPDVTEDQLEAIKRAMKPPPSPPLSVLPVSEPQEEPVQTPTPPNTPAPEELGLESLSLGDSAATLPAKVMNMGVRRQRSRGPQQQRKLLHHRRKCITHQRQGPRAASLVRGGRRKDGVERLRPRHRLGIWRSLALGNVVDWDNIAARCQKRTVLPPSPGERRHSFS